MTTSAPLVFVIDDDISVRRSLVRLLRSAGLQVQAYASAEEFLQQPTPEGPACIILDVQMPGLGGLDVQRTLAERNINLPIVFLTGHGDIPMTVRAMKAGADNFLPKPFDGEDLLSAVRQAIAKHSRTRQTDTELAEIRHRVDSLSPREREVMALVVSGKLNKQTGRCLGVSEKTVKAHRARVMEKMQVDSLAELVRIAEKIGVPTPQP